MEFVTQAKNKLLGRSFIFFNYGSPQYEAAANLYFQGANEFTNDGNYKEAIKYYILAIDNFKLAQTNNIKVILGIYESLILCYNTIDEIDNCIKCLIDASVYKFVKDDYIERIAQYKIKKGDIIGAIRDYDSLIDFFDYTSRSAKYCIRIVGLYTGLGNHYYALKYLIKLFRNMRQDTSIQKYYILVILHYLCNNTTHGIKEFMSEYKFYIPASDIKLIHDIVKAYKSADSTYFKTLLSDPILADDRKFLISKIYNTMIS